MGVAREHRDDARCVVQQREGGVAPRACPRAASPRRSAGARRRPASSVVASQSSSLAGRVPSAPPARSAVSRATSPHARRQLAVVGEPAVPDGDARGPPEALDDLLGPERRAARVRGTSR